MGGEPRVPAILVSQEERFMSSDTEELGLYARVLMLTVGSTITENDYNKNEFLITRWWRTVGFPPPLYPPVCVLHLPRLKKLLVPKQQLLENAP